MCEAVRTKLPPSWTRNGDFCYCSTCWSTVKCTNCGAHDPKGQIFRGRWHCGACRKGRGRAAGNPLDTYHRAVIADHNGEAPSLDFEASGPSAFPAAVDDGALEAAEAGDALAPLPSDPRGGRRPPAAHGGRRPGHIVLLLDTSGSMRTVDARQEPVGGKGREEPPAVARCEAAARCAADFVRVHGRLQPRDVFSLATFDEASEQAFVGLDARDASASLEMLPLHCSRGTSYRTALVAAASLLKLRPGAPAHVLLLSDGQPGDAKAALEYFQAELLQRTGTGRSAAGFRLHGIGFGALVQSFASLQQLACLGGGTFALAGSSVRGLCEAFASVSSTITSLSDSSSLAEPLDAYQDARSVRMPRPANFEFSDGGAFGKRGVLRFSASRTSFQYDGADFQAMCWPPGEVARRIRPHMRGGMRLVYDFQDTRAAGDESGRMVAKCSRWLNEVLNGREAVEAYAKSTAVARHYAARFNEHLSAKVPGAPRLFFVPCFVYEVEGAEAPPEGEPQAFAGERYLPGAFLKYTSNNGYAAVPGPGMRHCEVVQAFTHFSLVASGGRLLVADLQGVAREAEVLLTDPQVLSLDGRRFGPGDLRGRGVRACLSAHRCGPTCRLLGLRPPGAAMLRRLAPAPTAADPNRTPSTLSSSWELWSEPGSGSSEWEQISEQALESVALSEGSRSTQASSTSWVHLLDS